MNDTATLALSYQLYLGGVALWLLIAVTVVQEALRLIGRRHQRPLLPMILNAIRALVTTIMGGLVLLQIPKLAYAAATDTALEAVTNQTMYLLVATAVLLLLLHAASFIATRRAEREAAAPV